MSAAAMPCCCCCWVSAVAISFVSVLWQGQRASNPQPSVLETDALPIELCPCGGSSPKYLLDDLRDDAGAHRLAALADGKAKPLLHGDGRDQRHHHLHVVPGHHHFGALG